MKRVDVAIVGASLAGAACVRMLTRLGIDAVALDRDTFPREKVCGGFLSPGALDALDELGVLDCVRAAGAVEIKRARLRFRGHERELELPRPGLGISRRTLDSVVGNHEAVVHGNVQAARPVENGFLLEVDGSSLHARVVVDASGKLGRLSPRVAAPQFGIQFYEAARRSDALDFWFFGDGYGGIVDVDAATSNACFLIKKDALPRYLSKPGCRITGPIAYEAKRSEFIAIGDAAGMIDPFCGEGMRHALDTGRTAAMAVAEGLRRGWPYDVMRGEYEARRDKRWRAKRFAGRLIRGLLPLPVPGHVAFRLRPERILRALWG